MADIIQLRRDTAANWTAENPTLANGEIGYETDTEKFKIGDGVTAWNALGYWTEGTAIHDNIAGEIAAIANKAAPVDGDFLIIEDSEDGNEKKHILFSECGGADADAIHDNVANEISAIANKAVPVDYDLFVIEDSEAGHIKKELNFGDLEATISHDSIADVSADDHHAQTHTLDSHTATTLADPGADRIVYWDDSDTEFQFLEPTTGISINGDELVFDHVLAADLDLGVYEIVLDEDPADHTASGMKAVYTAGENLVFGNLVYMKAADSKMWKAQANAEGTCHVCAIALATIAADASGDFLLYGIIEDADFNFTIGANVWLDDDTAGLATSTQPADAGDMVISIGQCKDHADRMLFSPDKTWIELG